MPGTSQIIKLLIPDIDTVNVEYLFSFMYLLMWKKSPALICAREVFQFLDQKPTIFEPIFIHWTEAGKRQYYLDIMKLQDSQESYL